MFEITYQNEKEEKNFIHQNSWGFTTRSIGAMIMTHSDNKGLIIPPNIAKLQIIIIPILFKNKEILVLDFVKKVHEQLSIFTKTVMKTY